MESGDKVKIIDVHIRDGYFKERSQLNNLSAVIAGTLKLSDYCTGKNFYTCQLIFNFDLIIKDSVGSHTFKKGQPVFFIAIALEKI